LIFGIWDFRSNVCTGALYKNPLTNEPTNRFQPSTSTKSMSLNGRDMKMGGNIIMPVDKRTLATTISMIKKGI